MPLSVSCTCGKTYKVDEELAGRRVKCKACGASLEVPLPPADDLSDLGDLAGLMVPAAPAAPAALEAPDPFADAGTPGPLPATTAPLVPSSAFPTKAPSPQAAPSGGAMPFFLAVSSGWSKSLLYRVYMDRDALLLMDVGPYNVMIDLEIARRTDGSHWSAKTVQALKTWVVSTGGVALAAVGLLGIAFARFAFQKPNEVLQIISLLIVISAFVIPGILLLATWSLRIIVLRSQQLDRLSPDDIRRQAVQGKDKYRLAPGELSNVRLFPPSNSGPAIKHLAEATFKHASGNWRLMLFTPQDVRQAVSAFRQLFGRDLEVDPGLQNM